MASKPTTRQMSDSHEQFLEGVFRGKLMPGSGNQWAKQTDVRNKRHDVPFAFAVDGKSSFAKSISISLAMWDKLVEQANGERPALALRWYEDYRLQPVLDLIAIEAGEFEEILEAARKYEALRRAGKAE